MNVLWTIGVVASLLFAWVCLFHIIPSCLMSMFRYRLWRQRDGLAGEIRNGKFANPEQAECLVDLIERFIRLAPQFSAFRIALARESAAISREEPPATDFDLSGLDESEREIFESYREDFFKTVFDHVFFETPSGWLAVASVLLFAPVILLLQLIRRDDHDQWTLTDDARRRVSQGSVELARNGSFLPELATPHFV
jgi:hypothetical protein